MVAYLKIQGLSPRAPSRLIRVFRRGAVNRPRIAKAGGKAMKFKPGDMLPRAMMEAVTGEAINLPGAKRLVHLQFRRFVD